MAMAAVRSTRYFRLLCSVRIPQSVTSTTSSSSLLACPPSLSSSQATPTISSTSFPGQHCRFFGNHSKDQAEKAAPNDTTDPGDDSDWEDDVDVPFDADADDFIPSRASSSRNNFNDALQSVIDSGLDELKTTSTLISNKKETRKPLFHKGAIEGADQGPTKQQLAEANRVFSAATQSLEEMHRRNKKGRSKLEIGGFSILVVHVEVNANLREANVFWALPFEILMEANEPTRQELTERMQKQLVEGGAGRFLQGEVHRLLSHYYPPKLKFKPAPDALLQQYLDFS